ncbi:sugar ABC transporter permease [Microbispora sp. NPDC046933]|uniref:carbohydrate ABC transporter permease n=1 Tax=Microbispora sp. NPDC046933 TaxID=3155618 RepID=UPI0033FFB301
MPAVASPVPETASRRRQRLRMSPLERSRRRLFVPFVYPALLVYAAVMVAPTVFTLWISLNHWAGAGPMQWAGLSNYTRMFKDPVFRTSFVNTFWIVFGVGVGVFAIAFLLTMLLHDMVGRKLARAVVFFPSLVPGIAISILWGFLFNYPDGLVDTLLVKLGVDHPPAWLAQDNAFKTILVGMMWLTTGTYTVIFMAAVDRIPRELYEAAELEGAGPFARFRHVTFPLMRDIVSVCSVLWCVGALKTFEFLLTFSAQDGALPSPKLWNFAMYSYGEAFNPDGVPDYGISSACGVIVLVLTGGLAVLSRRILRKDSVTY